MSTVQNVDVRTKIFLALNNVLNNYIYIICICSLYELYLSRYIFRIVILLPGNLSPNILFYLHHITVRGGGGRNSFLFLFLFFNTYFTSVVPTALLLQCNWPITGIRRVL